MVVFAALFAADRVDFEGDVPDAEEAEELVHKGDDLGVGRRGKGAEQLHPQLVEFPHPPRLGLFRPEAGDRVGQLDRQRAVNQPVFDDRPVDAGGPFRPEGEFPPALVGEGVHLLLDDVGGVADRADEEPLVLESRDADLPEAVLLGGIEELPLDKLPLIAVRREDVGSAFDRFDF